MEEKITFTINGRPVTVEVDPETLVIDVIRDVLNLTGTKRGCDNSVCGTCTIVVNGKAVKSCNMAVKKIAGADVITVEGLAKGTELHPVQKAISESGAVQCGFCTPGMVLTAHALLLSNNSPTREQIRKALQSNLCRCTGYQQIVDAIEAASVYYK